MDRTYIYPKFSTILTKRDFKENCKLTNDVMNSQNKEKILTLAKLLYCYEDYLNSYNCFLKCAVCFDDSYSMFRLYQLNFTEHEYENAYFCLIKS